MKANELMIGDWVLAEGKPVQVTNISVLGGDIIRVINPFMSYDTMYASNIVALSKGAKDINMIEPIPLTLEILEKNGWCLDEIDGSYRHYDNGFWIGGRNAPFGIMVSNLYQDINYVHELQHLLKLCGINKEIVLW